MWDTANMLRWKQKRGLWIWQCGGCHWPCQNKFSGMTRMQEYVWVEDKMWAEEMQPACTWLLGSAMTKSKKPSCRWRGTRVKERLLDIFICGKGCRVRNGCYKVGGKFLCEQSPWVDETWNPESKWRDCLQQEQRLVFLVIRGKARVWAQIQEGQSMW